MPNLNKVMLMGNLTRDPELRHTPSGTPVADFGLAINRRYKDGHGELQEEATFVDITAWGRQAEVLQEYVRKGDPLFVEGRLRLDEWEAKDGSGKRRMLKVVCQSFEFLARREGDGQGQAGHRQDGARSKDRERQPANGPYDRDGDIPF